MSQLLLLVINTDSYAGNFEREMVAYATGMYDEYMGEDEGKQFETWAAESGVSTHTFACLVDMHLNDDEDYGMCYASIHSGPDGLYNSVRFAVSRMPTEEELNIIKERVEDYATCNNIKILSYQLITQQTTSTTVEI